MHALNSWCSLQTAGLLQMLHHSWLSALCTFTAMYHSRGQWNIHISASSKWLRRMIQRWMTLIEEMLQHRSDFKEASFPMTQVKSRNYLVYPVCHKRFLFDSGPRQMLCLLCFCQSHIRPVPASLRCCTSMHTFHLFCRESSHHDWLSKCVL